MARPSLAELFVGANEKKARNQQIHEAARVHEYALLGSGRFLGALRLYHQRGRSRAGEAKEQQEIKVWPTSKAGLAVCAPEKHP